MSASVCRCGGPLCSFEWSTWTGQNHRAKPGQAVCSGCGTGFDVSADQYAHLLIADRAYEKTMGHAADFEAYIARVQR